MHCWLLRHSGLLEVLPSNEAIPFRVVMPGHRVHCPFLMFTWCIICMYLRFSGIAFITFGQAGHWRLCKTARKWVDNSADSLTVVYRLDLHETLQWTKIRGSRYVWIIYRPPRLVTVKILKLQLNFDCKFIGICVR